MPSTQGKYPSYGGTSGPRDGKAMGGAVQAMPGQGVPTSGTTVPNQGIPQGGSNPDIPQGGYPTPVENPYPIETDPGYQFRLNEGMRVLERGAGARGGLLSGGFARKALRYGQDFASHEYSNIYNRISNIAGLGQVAAQSGGAAAMQAGANMGQAASDRALSSAYGAQGQANAWGNAANQIANLPWGSVFNSTPTGSTTWSPADQYGLQTITGTPGRRY